LKGSEIFVAYDEDCPYFYSIPVLISCSGNFVVVADGLDSDIEGYRWNGIEWKLLLQVPASRSDSYLWGMALLQDASIMAVLTENRNVAVYSRQT
jgi:hypothetical protein